MSTSPAYPIERQRAPQVRAYAHRLLNGKLSIGGATAVYVGSYLLSALLGTVLQMQLNWLFGAGSDASAFYAALRVPELLINLVAGRALLAAAIPMLVKVSSNGADSEAWQLANSVLSILLAGLAAVVFVVALAVPGLMSTVVAPGFDPQTARLATSLTQIMLLQPLLFAIAGVGTAVLHSRREFLLAGLAVGLHNIPVIFGAAAGGRLPWLGIYGPAVGTVVAAAFQIVVLLPGLKAAGYRFRFVWRPRDPRLSAVFRVLVPSGLWTGIGYSGFIVDTAFASMVAQAAAVPAIYNAWLLIGLPISLLGKSVSIAAFPRLAEQAVSEDWGKMGHTVRYWLGAMLALAVPAAVGAIVVGRPMIRLLFERGKYDAAAGDLTYEVLAVYALALPAYVAIELLTRVLIALGDARTPLVSSIVRLAGRTVVTMSLVAGIGAVAIPAAFAATGAGEALVLGLIVWIALRHRAAARSPSPDRLP